MSTAPAAHPPAASRPGKFPCSQRWLLLALASAVVAAPLPPEAKALGLLACLGAMALAAAKRWRAARQDLEVAGADSQSPQPAPATPQERWAGNRAALYQVGDSMVADAARDGGDLSLVVFEQVDLPELHAVFGGGAAQALVAEFSRRVKELAGPRGVAVRADATCWAVLLPLDEDRALAAVRRALGPHLATEVDVGGEEILLVPRIALHTVGQRVAPMRSVLHELRLKIRRAQELEQLREDYLRRERESHSRPAPLFP